MTVEVPIWCQPKVLVRDSQLCLVWVIGEGLNPEPDLPLDFIFSGFKNIPAKERNTMTRNIISQGFHGKLGMPFQFKIRETETKLKTRPLWTLLRSLRLRPGKVPPGSELAKLT